MIDRTRKFIKDEAERFGAKNNVEYNKPYIERNNTGADALKDNGAFFGFIHPAEENSGPFHDFSLTIFPNDIGKPWLICLGVGSSGFKNDYELATYPGLKRLFSKIVDKRGYCKSDFSDIESSLPKSISVLDELKHIKNTLDTYKRFLPAIQIIDNPESDQGKKVISAFVAAYAKLRNWASNKDHRDSISKALADFLKTSEVNEEDRSLALQKQWFRSADKRIIGQYLQKFVSYNSESFDFLGVTPYIEGIDQNVGIYFRTAKFVGTAPLRSPDTGKQIGDFVVVPRYTEQNRYSDYIEILNILGDEISPEIIDSLPLASGHNFRPPLYLEATKFIVAMAALVKQPWRKFDRIEKISYEPLGQINWNKYISNEFKIESRLSFPTGKNVMSELHKEYFQLRYVFDICKKELLSSNTPLRVKLSMKPMLDTLEDKLYFHFPLKTNAFFESFSDSIAAKRAKQQANKILRFDLEDGTAWRVDFSDVFEKFVQYIFKKLAKDIGGDFSTNHKLNGYTHSRKNSWELGHLEPDGILQKDNIFVFIDAKYKSHLYNKFSSSESLKDAHRHDLHQIMAYASFSADSSKYGILCYPSPQLEIKEITYVNQINNADCKIKILGLPLNVEIIGEAKHLLMRELAFL